MLGWYCSTASTTSFLHYIPKLFLLWGLKVNSSTAWQFLPDYWQLNSDWYRKVFPLSAKAMGNSEEVVNRGCLVRLKFLNFHPIKYRMRGRKTKGDLRNRTEENAKLTVRRMKGFQGYGGDWAQCGLADLRGLESFQIEILTKNTLWELKWDGLHRRCSQELINTETGLAEWMGQDQ